MITALTADYRSVYYLELDRNWGVCYQSHSDISDGFKVGEEFPYLESVTAYANQYITEQYREDFLRFIQPESIREGLAGERVISYTYMVERNGRESYEVVRFASVTRPDGTVDGHINQWGLVSRMWMPRREGHLRRVRLSAMLLPMRSRPTWPRVHSSPT